MNPLQILSKAPARGSTAAGCREHSRLRRDAAAALYASGYRQLLQLSCEVSGETIVLTGRVPSWHLKQVAQAVLLRLWPQRDIENRVQVAAATGGSNQ